MKVTKKRSKTSKIIENERSELLRIDEIDRQILAELSKNGRIPAKELARKLDVHHNTLLQRLKRLEKSGLIIKYLAEIDYGLLGYDLEVVIFLKMKKDIPYELNAANLLVPGNMGKLDSLLNMKELRSFHAITGEWDVISLWRVRNKQHLNRVIKEISCHPAITNTKSHVILCTYRNSYQYNPFGEKSKDTINPIPIS